jgi:hypothetical protein
VKTSPVSAEHFLEPASIAYRERETLVRLNGPTGALTVHAAGRETTDQEVSHNDARCALYYSVIYLLGNSRLFPRNSPRWRGVLRGSFLSFYETSGTASPSPRRFYVSAWSNIRVVTSGRLLLPPRSRA